jgi:2-polyprenyl-3-methyl-5-hydroxy-6-metoxy-1,4-benzoquinol methylase
MGIETSGKWETVHVRPDQPQKRHHEVVAELAIKHTPASGRLLDIGCGTGHILQLIRQSVHDLELTAADAYEGCLQETLKRVPGTHGVLLDPNRFAAAELGSEFISLEELSGKRSQA